MREYNDLLHEVGIKISEIRSNLIATAKEYIPKLYQALITEHPEITSLEARQKIENDCKKLWKKRTILFALPNEVKNQKKQMAGRQRHTRENLNRAAIDAAPELKEKKFIVNKLRESSRNEILYSEPFKNNHSINHKYKENLQDNLKDNLNEDILNFEFSLQFRMIQQYMAHQYKTLGDHGYVWFHGVLNIKSGRIIEANIGKKVDDEEI